MLDTSRIIGKVLGENLYRFEGCKRYCGSTKDPNVYLENDDGSFEKTDYLYFDRIRTTYAKEFTRGVLDKKLITIKGHYMERIYENNKRILTIDGEKYEIYPFNGWIGEAEYINNDNGFRHFMDRHVPNTISLEPYKDTREDDNDESVFFVKFNNYVAVMTPEDVIYEKEFKEGSTTEEERAYAMEHIYPALEIIRLRYLVGGTDRGQGYVDKTSFVNIKEKDSALCFNEIEAVVSTNTNLVNMSELGRRLGLAKDTAQNVKARLKKKPEDSKSLQKMFFYKVSFGYMKATLSHFHPKS